MKTLYYVILYLAMFQMAALVISGLGVFPTDSSLFSDFDMQEFSDIEDPEDMLSYIFFPNGLSFGGINVGDYQIATISMTTVTIIGIITVFVGVGAAFARLTQSYAPVVLAVIGILFYPMITHSFGFFRKMFTHWDVASMSYLAVSIGLGILILFVFLIVETPTHGGA